MNDQAELSKLRWRCRRGMQEMDIMLQRYLERCYGQAEEAEQQAFAALLDTEDDQLWDWLIGRAQPGEPSLAQVVDQIRALGP